MKWNHSLQQYNLLFKNQLDSFELKSSAKYLPNTFENAVSILKNGFQSSGHAIVIIINIT